ncbi:protease inhibitor I42 family protein [Bacillus toyonensis]|uniref:protease inhibitor I42 family protein n=1 Tax=Bacillus toyonensis TaxID=155322 RepID=UPI001F0A3885|nr:protease inhibitor I42 family protein [Bacillus toyonensis]
MMILTEKDLEHTLNISMNEVFTIQLEENPTTGYRWMLETVSNIKLIKDDFILLENTVGGAGIRIFQLCTTNKGLYEIYIKKWQEWIGETSVIKKFKILINVE